MLSTHLLILPASLIDFLEAEGHLKDNDRYGEHILTCGDPDCTSCQGIQTCVFCGMEMDDDMSKVCPSQHVKH